MEIIIEEKLRKRFDDTQKRYLQATKRYAPEYDFEIEFVDLAERRKNRKALNRIQSHFPPSFSMHISMSSEKFRKRLEFKISDGTNTDNIYYHSLKFSVEHDKQWFSLKDYFTHNGIKEEIDDFFKASDDNETTAKITKFIGQIEFLLQQDDIGHILSSNDWIHVPHDKSMYF